MFQRHSTAWWILKRAAARLIKTHTNYLRFIDIIPSFKTISTLCFKYQIQTNDQNIAGITNVLKLITNGGLLVLYHVCFILCQNFKTSI